MSISIVPQKGRRLHPRNGGDVVGPRSGTKVAIVRHCSGSHYGMHSTRT